MTGKNTLKVSPEIVSGFSENDAYATVKGIPVDIKAIVVNMNIDKHTRESIARLAISQYLDEILGLFEIQEGEEYKRGYTEARGSGRKKEDIWWVDIQGYYQHPLGYQYEYFSCPSKKLPYTEVKYKSGSPTLPAYCRLKLVESELEKLEKGKIRISIPIIEWNDIKIVKGEIVVYKDRKNHINIYPDVTIKVENDGVKVVKSGYTLVDWANNVYVKFYYSRNDII